jgi:hypothetical protein
MSGIPAMLPEVPVVPTAPEAAVLAVTPAVVTTAVLPMEEVAAKAGRTDTPRSRIDAPVTARYRAFIISFLLVLVCL